MPENTETKFHGAMSIPRDPSKAEAMLRKTFNDIKTAPFWRAGKWAVLLPPGVRPYPEVACVDQSDAHFKNGYVLLKYFDGSVSTLSTKKMHKGELLLPCEITKKWVVCAVGEKNLHGKVYDE